MTTVCIWQGRDSGWYWDDSEDHGGFDRISPMGPHDTEAAAEADARDLFPGCAIEAGPPLHYRDGDDPQSWYLPEGFALLAKPFSVPEIGVWMDESEYLRAVDLIDTAASLAGDGAGGELGLNPEYERGMAELIMRFMCWPCETVPEIIRAIHGTARDNARKRGDA